jgi:SAM-dependent methyltransferase
MATSVAYVRHWFASRRWWRGALRTVSRASRWLIPSRPAKYPFDRRHGMDTDGLFYSDQLSAGHEHDRHSAGYYATAPSLFHGAIALWSETLAESGQPLTDFTLVDVGCGKGRAVMLASEYGFREIVGVELNSRLAAVAKKNLHKWLRSPRACANVAVVHGDALSFPVPDGPVVLFFFNSFEQEMVEMWLDRLAHAASARTHPIDLIYVHPEFDALVRRVPGMQAIAHAEIPFSAEDAAADVFGVAVDDCAIYRLSR